MILNLTQHPATVEQAAAGVVDLPADERARLVELLTFDQLPRSWELADRATRIARLPSVASAARAMIGGAPYLMGPLERSLEFVGVQAVYAFSIRESMEQTLPDGSVQKTAKFRHAGFVPAFVGRDDADQD